MIKFIATDLDGTLLNERGELPETIFSLISRLEKRGILFAPASGRQHANLCSLFAPVSEKLLFVCENGALVRKGGKTLYLNPLPAPLVKDALSIIRAADGIFPILCGADTAFIEDLCEPFRSRVHASYSSCEEVASLDKYLETEPICKISVFDGEGAAKRAMRLLPPRLRGVKLTLSGEHWCDVSAPSTDKGEAIRTIQRLFGFAPEECMAFGDQMNDLGMFRVCARSRAVANAVPELKAQAEAVVPSNRENGVFVALEELLNAM